MISRSEFFRRTGPVWLALLVGVLCVLSARAIYRDYERDFQLSVVPDALGVTTLSYSLEESWGFGPGGNEAGIRVYPLPPAVAAAISRSGLSYFSNLPANADQQQRGWRGAYSDWQQTPIRADDSHWGDTQGSRLEIRDYICRYGFCIDIAADVAARANAIINSPGSYYAYGRIGLIVVSPDQQLVLYLYNG